MAIVNFQSAFGDLSPGASGEAVRELQDGLAQMGFAPAGGTDGSYGAGTKTAVQAYQASVGLDTTGTADTATLNALADATGHQIDASNVSKGSAALPTMNIADGLTITASAPSAPLSTTAKIGLGLAALGVVGLVLGKK